MYGYGEPSTGPLSLHDGMKIRGTALPPSRTIDRRLSWHCLHRMSACTSIHGFPNASQNMTSVRCSRLRTRYCICTPFAAPPTSRWRNGHLVAKQPQIWLKLASREASREHPRKRESELAPGIMILVVGWLLGNQLRQGPNEPRTRAQVLRSET